MRIAIMQPYVMPYLGYFQMVAAVDEFVLLDDVNFIKKGWIHRNRILLNGEPHGITIPIAGMSQNKWIEDSMVADTDDWRPKLLVTPQHAYAKAPFHAEVYPFLERIINRKDWSIADMAEESLLWVVERLGLPVKVLRSSQLGLGEGLRAQERIVAIAKGAVPPRTSTASAGGNSTSPGRSKPRAWSCASSRWAMHPMRSGPASRMCPTSR